MKSLKLKYHLVKPEKYIKKRRGKYYFDRSIQGERVKVSLHTDNYLEAVQKARDLLEKESTTVDGSNLIDINEIQTYAYCPKYWSVKRTTILQQFKEVYGKLLAHCWQVRSSGHVLTTTEFNEIIVQMEALKYVTHHQIDVIKKLVEHTNRHIRPKEIQEIGKRVNIYGIEFTIDAIYTTTEYNVYLIYHYGEFKPYAGNSIPIELAKHYLRQNNIKRTKLYVVDMVGVHDVETEIDNPKLESSILHLTIGIKDRIIFKRVGQWCERCGQKGDCSSVTIRRPLRRIPSTRTIPTRT